MHKHKPIQALFLMLAMAGLAACASSGGSSTSEPEPSGEGISIRVVNDMNPPTTVVVWVVPETGNRGRLGSIPPNGRRSFNYVPLLQSVRVYLTAEPEGPVAGTMGRTGELRSNDFSVVGAKTVDWSVSQRNVRVGGG